METADKVIVQKSYKKLFFLSIGCLIFITLGVIIIYSGWRHSHYYQLVIGTLTILFFTSIMFFVLRSILDKRPALILDRKGIDMSFGNSPIGLIEWSDINDIKISKTMSSKMILILLNSNEKYISRSKNPIMRKTMELSVKTHGTPIALASYMYKINTDELYNLVLENASKYGVTFNEIY